MNRKIKLALVALLTFSMQNASARIAGRVGGDEFGRAAEVDELLKLEAAEENEIFYRALQGSMSMSMSMDMSMSMSMAYEETPVDGATGETPGEAPEETADAATGEVDSTGETTTDAETTSSETTEETPSIPLQPLDETKDDSESSAERVIVGLSCLVGFMGLLLF